MPAHKYVVKLVQDLPTVWLRKPPEEWYLEAATQLQLERSKISSRVCFELPDCRQARASMEFCIAQSQARSEEVTTVALVNLADFEHARGPGSAFRAIKFLYDHGFPADYLRIAYLT